MSTITSTLSALAGLTAQPISTLAELGPDPNGLQVAHFPEWELESGELLLDVQVAYQTWGCLTPARDNAVLVCHALTGNTAVDVWWPGLFGSGHALDPERDFVICTNVLGGCAGTTGPASPRPGTEAHYAQTFPTITIRDMVRLQGALLERLGIDQLRLVIGGSMGGMQALEWPLIFPERVAAVVAIATSARHSAWCIGWSEAQRQALYADPAWRGGAYRPDAPPRAGLAAARAVAMLTYRSWSSFETRFGRRHDGADFAVAQYLDYQGAKLVARFDANSYVTLTRAMDLHDVGRERGGVEAALAQVWQPVLVVTIPSDVLYPPVEQERLASLLPQGQLVTLDSVHGHDGFLIDSAQLDRLVVDFRRADLGRVAA